MHLLSFPPCFRHVPLSFALATAAMVPWPVRADALSTTFAGGNGQDGVMFDIRAARTIRVTGLRIAFQNTPLTDSIEVFTKPGTHVGSETVPGAWTSAGMGNVTASAINTASEVFPIPQPFTVQAGRRMAIYIERAGSTGWGVSYTDGDGTGTVEATDDNLTIYEGSGIQGSFAAVEINKDRIPNVTVVYEAADNTAPKVTIKGRKKVRTGKKRHVVRGRATDDTAVASVRIRYQKPRANGGKRTVTRKLRVASNGKFRKAIQVIPGRNKVRIDAVDKAGNRSRTVKVIVIGTN